MSLKLIMAKQTNTLRIIAGEHRGRKLNFVDAPNLRPTPDRMRETLFNWLQPVIYEARCLDLFAGSGALGLEALSRGASDVVFVEKDAKAAQRLNENLQLLGYDKIKCQQKTAQNFLQGEPELFDVVFLDPPYQSNMLPEIITQLDDSWLAEGARIYLEHDSNQPAPELPAHWQRLKESQAGQATAILFQYGRG